MEEMDVLRKLILQKLVRGNVWGGKHTPIDFVIKGVPEHYRNTHKGKKIIEKVLKELANDQWIINLSKRTGGGSDDHVSLNPRKVWRDKTVSSKDEFIEGSNCSPHNFYSK